MARLTSLRGVNTPEALRAWACANYNNGADSLVECYTTQDLVQHFFTGKRGGLDRGLVRSVVGVWADRQADARHHSRCW